MTGFVSRFSALRSALPTGVQAERKQHNDPWYRKALTALSPSRQSDVVQSGGEPVTTTYGSEDGTTLPGAWQSVPEGAESPGLPAAVDDVLPEFKVAFYPDTNFVRGGKYGLGAITPDNGQSGALGRTLPKSSRPSPLPAATRLTSRSRRSAARAQAAATTTRSQGGPTSGSTGGSSSATQTAASENGSGTEVASAASSSGGAWVRRQANRGVGLIRRVVGVECGRHELGGLCSAGTSPSSGSSASTSKSAVASGSRTVRGLRRGCGRG